MNHPRHHSPARTLWPDLLAVLALLGAVAWLVWPMVTGRGIYFFGDGQWIVLPRFVYYHQALREGVLPLWHPGIAAGAPADPFYAPSHPLYLLNFLLAGVKDPLLAFGWGTALALALAALSFFLFSRVALRVGVAGSALGAGVYLLNGFTVATVEQTPFIHVLGWLPLVLLGLWRWLATGRPLWLGVLAFCFAMQWLAFFFQLSLFLVMLAAAVCAAWPWLAQPGEKPRSAGAVLGVLAALLLGTLAAMVALGPFFQHAAGAERSGWRWQSHFDPAMTLGWRHVVAMFLPKVFGTQFDGSFWTLGALWSGTAAFWGMGALLLVAWAGRASLGRRGWFFVGVVLFGLLVSFGEKTPVGLLVLNLPGLHAFPRPARFLFLMVVGMAPACALAFDAAAIGTKPGRWWPTLGVVLALAGLALLLVTPGWEALAQKTLAWLHQGHGPAALRAKLFSGGRELSFYQHKLQRALPLLLGGVGWGALVAGLGLGLGTWRASPSLKALGWLALVLWPMAQVAPTLLVFEPADAVRTPPPHVRWLRAHLGPHRLLTPTFVTSGLSQPFTMEEDTLFGLPLADGYLHFHPSLMKGAPNWEEHCRLFAARFATSRPTPGPQCGPWRRVKVFGGKTPVSIYELENPLPMAYLATRWRRGDHHTLLRQKAGSALADPARTVFLQRTPASAAHTLPPFDTQPLSARETARLRRPNVNTVVVTTNARFPRWLVVLDTFTPGWTATVDGAPTPIAQAFGGFKAVPLSPGKHRVVLRYWPASYTWALPVSLAAWGAILVLLISSLTKLHPVAPVARRQGWRRSGENAQHCFCEGKRKA